MFSRAFSLFLLIHLDKICNKSCFLANCTPVHVCSCLCEREGEEREREGSEGLREREGRNGGE